MIDFKYLYLGLCGLANAHKAGTLAGHLGAAVTTGYFIGEDLGELDDKVFTGVEAELDRVIAGEEKIWFNTRKTGLTPTDLFKPFPEKETTTTVNSIDLALRKNVTRARQSGHNVIFASIALRALHDHPEYATPEIVAGIRKLVEGFNGVHPGRGFFGKQKGWLSGNQVKLSSDDGVPRYESLQHMADIMIAEVIATASVRKQGFGGLWHLINHAAGILELERFGYGTTAKMALSGHHQHLRLWGALPDVEDDLGAVVKSDLSPLDPDYWDGMFKRDEARLTHRIKTLYGFHVLLRAIDDSETRQKASDAFLYLMA